MNKHFLFIFLTTLSTCALAGTNKYDWAKNWYIGGGINGNSQNTMTLNGPPLGLQSYLDSFVYSTVEQTNNSVGFDLYIGKEITRYWAAELGYTYVGKINFQPELLGIDEPSIDVNQWNVHLVGLGKLPVGEYVNFFIKAGIGYFGTDQEVELLSNNTIITDQLRTYALTYGVGGEFAWDHWGLRGEYNVIKPANNAQDDFYIADIISANLYYKFY